MYMNFFQKNKSVIVILLLISFLVVILVIFISGVADSNSRPTPTGSIPSQQSILVTSTNNLTAFTPRPVGTQTRGTPSSQTPTQSGPQGNSSPPPTLQSSVTEAAPPDNGPPPPTLQNQTPEATPAGNGPPPDS